MKETQAKLLLKGGRVINPASQFDEIADVLIEDGKIKAVAKDLSADGANVIDVANKIVAPGLIDIHVHLREPGQGAKEDFASGTKAAVAGGFTTVATMPNTNPVVDTAALVRSLRQRAAEAARCHVEIIGAVTKNQAGEELAELGGMAQAGAMAFSDDGHFIKKAKTLLAAYDYLRPFGKVVINHDEDTSLVEDGVMNEGPRSAKLGMKGRPTVAEDIAVARDILLAEYAGARVHVAHVTSANAVELVRQAKRRGVLVTAEVTPHHLALTEDCVEPWDSSTKVNPPLRTQKDRDALVAGLKDGTIDAIASDHAPHAHEEKDREYMYAPSGFPGLETSLAVVLTELFHTGKLGLAAIISKMSWEPAKIFALAAGTLNVGGTADVAVIDTEAEWTVDAKKFYTRGSHSPFVGQKLKGKAVMTIVEGKIVMRDGNVE